MSDFSRPTPIKHVRKPRRCYWCQTAIPHGDPAVKVAGVWDGTFDICYLHPDCADAWQRDECNAEDEGCLYPHERGTTCTDV